MRYTPGEFERDGKDYVRNGQRFTVLSYRPRAAGLKPYFTPPEAPLTVQISNYDLRNALAPRVFGTRDIADRPF